MRFIENRPVRHRKVLKLLNLESNEENIQNGAKCISGISVLRAGPSVFPIMSLTPGGRPRTVKINLSGVDSLEGAILRGRVGGWCRDEFFFAFLWASLGGLSCSVGSGKGFSFILDFLASNLQPLTLNIHRLSLRPTKMN